MKFRIIDHDFESANTASGPHWPLTHSLTFFTLPIGLASSLDQKVPPLRKLLSASLQSLFRCFQSRICFFFRYIFGSLTLPSAVSLHTQHFVKAYPVCDLLQLHIFLTLRKFLCASKLVDSENNYVNTTVVRKFFLSETFAHFLFRVRKVYL